MLNILNHILKYSMDKCRHDLYTNNIHRFSIAINLRDKIVKLPNNNKKWESDASKNWTDAPFIVIRQELKLNIIYIIYNLKITIASTMLSVLYECKIAHHSKRCYARQDGN